MNQLVDLFELLGGATGSFGTSSFLGRRSIDCLLVLLDGRHQVSSLIQGRNEVLGEMQSVERNGSFDRIFIDGSTIDLGAHSNKDNDRSCF